VTDSKVQEKYHHLDVVYNTHIFDIFLNLILFGHHVQHKDELIDLGGFILTDTFYEQNKCKKGLNQSLMFD
jgi:hypothetical protein